MGEPLRWPIGWMGLAPMADTTRDTAAAMLAAVRAAELSSQTLAVGLAAALKELVDREYEDHETVLVISIDRIEAIIEQLRTNNA